MQPAKTEFALQIFKTPSLNMIAALIGKHVGSRQSTGASEGYQHIVTLVSYYENMTHGSTPTHKIEALEPPTGSSLQTVGRKSRFYL
jgi:hypothetical protein